MRSLRYEYLYGRLCILSLNKEMKPHRQKRTEKHIHFWGDKGRNQENRQGYHILYQEKPRKNASKTKKNQGKIPKTKENQEKPRKTKEGSNKKQQKATKSNENQQKATPKNQGFFEKKKSKIDTPKQTSPSF